MKIKRICIALAVMSGVTSVHALANGEFDGPFVGGKIGGNRSSADGKPYSGSVDSTLAAGLEAGYNWQLDSALIGLSATYDFVDSHNADHDNGSRRRSNDNSKYGSNGGSLDLKLGVPIENWLPYVKVGYGYVSGTDALDHLGAGAFHGGAGVEYKLAPNWGLAGEWTTTRPTDHDQKLRNNTLTLNLNYYFGGAAPAPVVAPVAPRPEPVVAPKPVVQEAPVPATEVVSKRFSLKSDVLFEYNKAVLKPAGKDALNAMFSQVAQMDVKQAQMAVTGYTDRLGSDKYNLDLGKRRAVAVANYLIGKGVPQGGMQALSQGKANPVTGNSCDKIKNRKKLIECLAPDRRVEIDVTGLHELQQAR